MTTGVESEGTDVGIEIELIKTALGVDCDRAPGAGIKCGDVGVSAGRSRASSHAAKPISSSDPSATAGRRPGGASCQGAVSHADRREEGEEEYFAYFHGNLRWGC